MPILHAPTEEYDVPDVPLDVLVARMRSRLAEADLDCRCREEIECRLDGLIDENARTQFHAALTQARAMRDTIRTLLGLLAELDEMDSRETDLSAFAEAADLFDDVCRATEGGAAAIRMAAICLPNIRNRNDGHVS